MKKVYSCLFILSFLISCDSDSATATQGTVNTELLSRTAGELPGNDANKYDEAGWVHNELFESYYKSESQPTTLPEIIGKVEALADANSNFRLIKTTSYHPVSVERVTYILDHKSSCVSDIIAASGLSSGAKLSLATFINELLVKFDTESSCEALYQYVAAYENIVLSNSNFTAKDKQLILTTTAVARHSTYLAKKKPKKNTDPDWIIFVGNVIAAFDGAQYGQAESVTEALVVGIASN